MKDTDTSENLTVNISPAGDFCENKIDMPIFPPALPTLPLLTEKINMDSFPPKVYHTQHQSHCEEYKSMVAIVPDANIDSLEENTDYNHNDSA